MENSHCLSASLDDDPGLPYRKVWRPGLEVAIKIKGSQGNPRLEWVKVEHPFTPISPKHDIHANHQEAFNSALRRRATAYRRRQNHGLPKFFTACSAH